MIEIVPAYRYGGWPSCVRLANREVDVVVTTDVGPRVIRYGPIGGENLFHEEPAELGLTGGDEFRSYGGHRLWHAPEDPLRTYAPDNAPVTIAWEEPHLTLTAPVELATGVEKRIELRLSDRTSEVTLLHQLTNRGPWTIELAPWGITALRPDGVAIIPGEPFVPFPEQLTPARALVLWPYTRLGDPRLRLGDRYVFLRQDPREKAPIKLGASVTAGWSAYRSNGLLFVKESPFLEHSRERYPDFGASVEVFANDRMLELETLGPMTSLEPGATVEHLERWRLWRGVDPIASEEDADREVLPRLGAR